jgi:hypothetical protein
LYVCTEKLTHFQMRYNAKIWQNYRGSTQTKGKYPKPRSLYPVRFEMGDVNALFFNILAPMASRETYFTKTFRN